ncbi:uncharacterized protein LOC103952782 isoform X2 [Pyrus x bretschneideri]|uniref:uncharacterized protein LOC103952782 isoform X2 n=1 Tax=Pyrus x bretschneideri TaxID=225117 RepID=UPI00202F66DB|nr:uncharacterized protein LOC103952782 isoform X2 [Pyrus x bretschneideri]
MVVKKSQSATHLVKDSKVEVCSNEDGFKGAWFPAKIIDSKPLIPATKKKRKSFSDGSSNSFSPTKAVVQYETLLSDDDPDKPLTEFVEMGQIRPVPPDDNVDRPFEPGDKVDAFHLDAWWPGVVIKREEDEYTVGFMYPPDLLVVRRSELRSHWDLADGVWVRAKKEMMMVSNFSPGTAVEMNPDEERLFYAWFPAIYLGQLGIDSFLLQYKKSNNSDVKIVVRGHQIRPQPPNSTERDFSLLDKVDAFHDMGWWVGDITKVLKGNKYAVTLSCTRQEKEFSLSELRTHMDWNDGGWATMSHGRWITEVREFHFRRGSEAQSKHSCQSSKRDYELQSCESFGNSDVGTPLRKKTPCSRISVKIQSKPLSPCTDKLPYGKTKKKLKMSPQPKDDATILTQPKDDATILSLYKKLKGGHSDDSLSLEKPFARRTLVKTLNKESPVINVLKIAKQKVRGLDDQALTHFKRKGKKSSEIEKTGEVNVGDEHVMDNTESSGIKSESEATGGSHAEASCLLRMEGVGQNEDGVSSAVEGNGKLTALLVEGEEHNGGGSMAADCSNDIFELSMITRLDLKGEKHDGTGVVAQVESTETQVAKDKGSEDAMVEEEAVHSAMDIDKGITSITVGSSNPAGISKQQSEVRQQVETGVIGSEEAMREMETVNSTMDYLTQEGQVAVTGVLPKTSAHDQPLSLCINEMHSVKTIGGTSNPAGTASQQNEVNGRQVEISVTGNLDGTPNQQNEVNGRQVETGVTDGADAEQNNMRQVETVDSPMGCLTKELQVAVTGISKKASAHDQPFLLCTSEMYSVKPTEGSSNPAETDNQQNEVTGTQVETGVAVNIEQQDSPDSPFVKSYPEIWQKVESMDAFRRYPQKPHFYPLVKCGELSRESLAIAKMLTFASLVEKTSKLNIEVPDDFFDSSFQELGDLETFGFDVKGVRDRLNSLLEMKVQLGQLQDKSKEVEIQIAEQTQERKKHNEKISGVAKQIKDLQDQLVVLMSEDAAKGTEISRLQSEENAIAESILSTRRNFEKLSEAW